LKPSQLEAVKEVQDKYRRWHEMAEKQLHEVSEQFPEFVISTLTQQHLELIAALVKTVSVSENEHLVRMNEVNNTLFLIARGVICICSEDAHGVRKEGALMAGEFFGEMALMGHGSANATVKSVMPCRLYTISRKHLLELLKNIPNWISFYRPVMSISSWHPKKKVRQGKRLCLQVTAILWKKCATV
jgi:CRP-like cAMP-binding protein